MPQVHSSSCGESRAQGSETSNAVKAQSHGVSALSWLPVVVLLRVASEQLHTHGPIVPP
jgi:hypothetical protein